MNIIVASNRKWYKKIIGFLKDEKLDINVFYIEDKAGLNYEKIKEISPKYIFFPHWSYIIPEKIYNNFTCIIFHMTDLPFGRGGSPLQNLISRGIYYTKISALKCQRELDSGDIFLKKSLSLYGNAEEIYLRAADIIKDMILEIIMNNVKPEKQIGDIVVFKRRVPKDSNIANLTTIEKVFDYIRMLDADGYPKAYIENGHFKFEFERAALKDGYIQADVKIYPKEICDE